METMIMENQTEKTTEIEMEPGIRWAVLKIMGPFWLQIISQHQIFRRTKIGP